MLNRNTSALIVIGSFDMFSKKIFLANLARIRKNLPDFFLKDCWAQLKMCYFFNCFHTSLVVAQSENPPVVSSFVNQLLKKLSLLQYAIMHFYKVTMLFPLTLDYRAVDRDEVYSLLLEHLCGKIKKEE